MSADANMTWPTVTYIHTYCTDSPKYIQQGQVINAYGRNVKNTSNRGVGIRREPDRLRCQESLKAPMVAEVIGI